MLAQAGLGGLQFAQAIPAMQANAVFAAAGGPFQDLVRRLEVFKQKVAMQDAFLRSGVKENLSKSINRLEVALLQLYKLAVFIRGAPGGDGMQKMMILVSALEPFQTVKLPLRLVSIRVNAAQDQLQNPHRALMQVVNQQNELNTRRAAIEQVAQQLPVLQATADALNKQSAALLAGFTELREKATQLALVMNDMRNGARDTGAQSWDKDRFAEGILRLCQMALIDGRVCDEAETITTEISSGYSGQVPGSVADLLTKVGQFARDVAQKSISG
ncbi:hypothetical protein CEK26_003185 [Fusarium fujikuroi]|nr:uncharacterized protein Y057_9876 [Fusarium fujikuroi]QGI70851.1 hypothetical protein CEK27_003180 [Fusarium fujikuroi]QGI88188.1 hypothetical protein CEK25_003144 [Fusarium fujikuroi]QGJ01741.1 hypothetical protein CEK26_003185 [Fusarium fujikuroi]